MSRSGYSEDLDHMDLVRWRGAVSRAIHGARGQRFLRDLIAALDAMPEKKLIAHAVAKDGCYCAMGAVGAARGIDDTTLAQFNYDPEGDNDDGYEAEQLGSELDIARAMAKEVAFINDEGERYRRDDFTDEQRWKEVRAWAASKLNGAKP